MTITNTDAGTGYTGTLVGFLAWIETRLQYGGIRISAPAPSAEPLRSDDERLYHRVEMVTGGYSDDEDLLWRVQASILGMYWRSSHAGGLYVYEIPVAAMSNDSSFDWLSPVDPNRIDAVGPGAIEVHDVGGGVEHYAAPAGTELRYRDEPDGSQTVVVIAIRKAS
ncbi:hypothetical protein [Cutibacterium avidum]|uniref:hypothetical protein n=1 Tax=Cutibacterium avidum TaxID=33010 RepID=UPI002FF14299